MRDHEPVVIEEFNGLFARGKIEVCPKDHFIQANNLIYQHLGVRTREGSVLLLDPNKGTINRIFKYDRPGEVSRLIILTSDGKLWDDSQGFVTPILNLPTMIDFSAIVLFNRLYISPHNGIKGLPGEKIYVYQGTGTARAAAGTPPASFTLGVVSGSSGNIETGKHLFAVAFETDSGFITAPGPVGAFTVYLGDGLHKVNITAIPVGPAGTVARHILVTKAIDPDLFTGNQAIYELFFVPNGKIADNTTVLLNNVNFYDADLVSSANYLRYELSIIPAGVGLGNYMGRMAEWGEDASGHTIRLSKSGEPESFSSTAGFILTNPGEGGDVKNCVEFRSLLYIYKQGRTFFSQDNGQEPNTWKVLELEAGIGTGPFGISMVLDVRGQTQDRYLVADRSGLYLFTGSFSEKPISWKIENVWKSTNFIFWQKIQVLIDSFRCRIYVLFPYKDATENSDILMGDYGTDFSPEGIKWSIWHFPDNPKAALLRNNPDTNQSELIWAAGSKIYKEDPVAKDDYGTAIPSVVRFAAIPGGEAGELGHFAALNLRVVGEGGVGIRIDVLGLDDTIIITPPSLPLSTFPGRMYSRLLNIISEYCSIQLSVLSSNHWFQITKLIIYRAPAWEERPTL